MTYEKLNSLLVGRCAQRKKLANNTYAIRNADHLAIRLHATDILQFWPDGKVVLNSGGWKTVTTKARLNEYSGLNISQNKGIWSVSKPGDWKNSVLFKDDMSFDGQKFSDYNKSEKKENELRKKIRDYSKLVVSSLPLAQPSGGDCWYCHLRENKTNKPLGDCTHNTEHFLSHFKEKYVVPSLVFNALEYCGCKPNGGGCAWFGVAFSQTNIGSKDQVGRFVKKYLYRQFGLA